MSSDQPAPERSGGHKTGHKKDPAPPPPTPRSTEPTIPFTRAAALWSALIAGFFILIVLLIFIAENTVAVQLQFLSLRWTAPLGVAILLAAVAGGLLTVFVGTARIYQLRRAAKKGYPPRR